MGEGRVRFYSKRIFGTYRRIDMLTEETFRTSLSIMQKELRRTLPNLNAGGCGRFAYLVGKKLKKHGIPFKLRLILSNELEYQDRREALDNIKNNREGWNQTSFPHCFVQVGDLCFDGLRSGEDMFGRYKRWHSWEEEWTYSLTEMFLAVKTGDWNWSFCTDTDLPKLERIIEKYLN